MLFFFCNFENFLSEIIFIYHSVTAAVFPIAFVGKLPVGTPGILAYSRRVFSNGMRHALRDLGGSPDPQSPNFHA